ncbi:MAG: hypothetical protein ACTSO9_10090 [Candidatus Helarchaeota archaeon]
MSFWLDWWMLMCGGIMISLIVKYLPKLGIKWHEYNMLWLKRGLMLFILSFFFLFSIGLFCGFTHHGGPGGDQTIGPSWMATMNDWFFSIIKNFWAPYYQIHPNATSTEFMFSSAQPWLRDLLNIQFDDLAGLTNQPMHLFVGICLFALYPYFLFIGTILGDLMFGGKPDKSGVWRMGWYLFYLLFAILGPILIFLSLQASIWNPMIITIVYEIILFGIIFIDYMFVLRKK